MFCLPCSKTSRVHIYQTIIMFIGGVVLISGFRAPEAQITGTIVGQITTSAGSTNALLPVSTDQDVCGKNVPDESIIVGNTGGLGQAIVTLSGTKAISVNESTVTNIGCRFAPHVQVVTPGTLLRITSHDQTLHTTHAYLDKWNETLFNFAIPKSGLAITRRLVKLGHVSLKCDAHPWMIGYILVTDEIGTVTDRDGQFELIDIIPGIYKLNVWHETLGITSKQINVTPGKSSRVTLSLNP